MTNKTFSYLLAASLFQFSAAVIAEELSPSDGVMTEDIFFADIPVTLTPSRIEQPTTEVPMSVSIIDRSMIDASGAVNLAEVLRLVPGMQMTYVNGAFPLVTYHGLSDEWSRRLQVQIDGRSIYLPLFSSVDWTNQAITLDDVERIEVIRGSNAPVYGSNAFIGVINIITRQPFDMQGGYLKFSTGTLDADAEMSAGLNGELGNAIDGLDARQFFARYAGAKGEWEYVGSFNYKTDRGFERMHDTHEISSGFLRTVYTPSAFDRLDVQFGMSGGEMNSGVADGMDGFILERPRSVLSHFQGLNWSHSFSPSQETTLRAYHNFYEQHDQFDVGVVSTLLGITPEQVAGLFGFTDQMSQLGVNDNIAERYDFEFEYQYHDLEKYRLNMVVGAGLRLDRFQSRWLIEGNDFISDFSQRLFANINWGVTSFWSIHAGAMLEHNQIIGSNVSPRLGSTIQINKFQALRFGVTRGVRTPSLLEANVRHSGQLLDGTETVVIRIHDENLRPEKLTSYEMGYLTDLDFINTLLDVKLFREEYEDLIYTGNDYGFTPPNDLAPFIDQYLGENLSHPFITHNGTDATISGFEAQIKQNPTPKLSVSLQYAYAMMEGTHLRRINIPLEDDPDGDGVRYETIDNAVPEHTFSILASYKLPYRLRLSSAFYRHSEMRWIGDGNTLNAYNRWDVVINKAFRVGSSKGDVSLKALNILGPYEEFRNENEFRSRVYLDLSLSF